MASFSGVCLKTLPQKHFVTMFSRGELSHGQVELYQIVQHKNIRSWEENELVKSQPRERETSRGLYLAGTLL